jgi:hypothetical protein
LSSRRNWGVCQQSNIGSSYEDRPRVLRVTTRSVTRQAYLRRAERKGIIVEEMMREKEEKRLQVREEK